jgi:RNA polymerase sigma-70 factor (ECF subfamily)
MSQNDDIKIIGSILEGNTANYSVLVDRYKDMVFSLILKVIRNREEAEEAAQDTFLKAFHALPGFKYEARFSTWLFRIAYNTAVSRTRKKSIITQAIDERMVENYSTDEVRENAGLIDEQQRIELMNAALKTLQKDEQMLINLFYQHQQSVEEIGMITGLSVSNVKVKLHRIRKKLYAAMAERMQLKFADYDKR